MPSKLQKFDEYKNLPNCFTFLFNELANGFSLKGQWHKTVFKNNNPIVLELGCGKGEYSVGLAKNNSNKNYIGVDIKSNRIWTGATQAKELKLNNIAFLRARIDFIDYCFDVNEVDEIWITFPDPQPQKTRAKARLTHIRFLNRYKRFLKNNGYVNLKTDSTSLYEFTLETLNENKLPIIWETNNLYKNCPNNRAELIEIKTHYETLFTEKGEDIKYVQFQLS